MTEQEAWAAALVASGQQHKKPTNIGLLERVYKKPIKTGINLLSARGRVLQKC